MNRQITLISYLSTLLIALIVSSCNNDIFIESENLPDITDITLDGNGEQWSSAFSRKGLTRIYVNPEDSSDDAKYLKYYGINGDVVDATCPFDELKDIQYDTPVRNYSIGCYGGMIYVICNYNVLPKKTVKVFLEYDYGMTKVINVTMTEGKPIEMRVDMPHGEPKVEWDFEKISHRRTMTNNSSLTQKLQLDPFEESRCSDQVIPKDSWAVGLTFDMSMPTYIFQEWAWEEYEGIRLGERRSFPQTVYAQDRLMVAVPPYTKATVTYTINYSRFTQTGTISLYNPVDDSWYDEDVTWTAIYATSYDYTVEYE
ncbi:MAG: hypothetical protein K2N48_07090 [Muribaculaceae bacterium]|nr:hypothetical protein [Muribaculaceae bacterium]